MYTYNKYITKTILPTLVVLTVFLTALVWITQILNMLSLIDKGMEIKNFFGLIILLVPYLLFMIIPIIAVISVIYTYSRLQEERQLIVLRSGGINNYDLLKPALIVAAYLTVISYCLSLYLVPITYNRLKIDLSNFRESYITNIIEEKRFNQISKNATIYVDKKNPDHSMNGVVLFDNKIAAQRTIFFAKTGEIIHLDPLKTEFALYKGIRHSYDNEGNLTKLHFDEMLLEISGDAATSNERSKISLALFIHEMLWPAGEFSPDKQKKLITDGHMRLIWPLYNFVLVFMGLSIFLNFNYSRRHYARQYFYIFLPIVITLYFHFTLQKLSYNDLNYIFLCYMNLFVCIVFSIWKNISNNL
jgi:lipopolysaccharide export system permease protein